MLIKMLLSLALLVTVTSCASTPEPESMRYTLPKDPQRVTVVQRRVKLIPGLPVQIKIGDITGGQVLVEVLGEDATTIVDTVSVKVHDVVTVKLGDQTFLVTLVELRNFLTSDDFAVFEVSESRSEPKTMSELEDTLEPDDTMAEEAEGDLGAP
jgi:hypothetical protein